MEESASVVLSWGWVRSNGPGLECFVRIGLLEDLGKSSKAQGPNKLLYEI